MCSQQMEHAQNDGKEDFQSYFRNPLISPPTHHGEKHDLS